MADPGLTASLANVSRSQPYFDIRKMRRFSDTGMPTEAVRKWPGTESHPCLSPTVRNPLCHHVASGSASLQATTLRNAQPVDADWTATAAIEERVGVRECRDNTLPDFNVIGTRRVGCAKLDQFPTKG